MLAPIVVFAFNRPALLQKTLNALAQNTRASESTLTVFCDGPRHQEEKKDTDAVQEIANNVSGFSAVNVVAREKNLGCAASIIAGLQQMFAQHERLIIIEDDILCSSHTLDFLNEGLERYAQCKTVFNIAAWSPPQKIFSVPIQYEWDVYAIPRMNGWGWATWRDRFESVDWNVPGYDAFCKSSVLRNAFDAGGADMSGMLDGQMHGKMDAWDIRMDYSRFSQGCVGINPVRSYTTNIGIGCGTHTTTHTDRYDNDISCALPAKHVRWLEHIFIDEQVRSAYVASLDPSGLFRRCLKGMLKKLHLFQFACRLKKRFAA